MFLCIHVNWFKYYDHMLFCTRFRFFTVNIALYIQVYEITLIIIFIWIMYSLSTFFFVGYSYVVIGPTSSIFGILPPLVLIWLPLYGAPLWGVGRICDHMDFSPSSHLICLQGVFCWGGLSPDAKTGWFFSSYRCLWPRPSLPATRPVSVVWETIWSSHVRGGAITFAFGR